MRIAKPVILTEQDLNELNALMSCPDSNEQIKKRCAIVLAAAEGLENNAIAQRVNRCRRTVGTWRNRYVQSGMAGLTSGAPRTGRRPITRSRVEAEVLRLINEPPPNGTRWTIRQMASCVKASKDTVQRIYAAHGLNQRKSSR